MQKGTVIRLFLCIICIVGIIFCLLGIISEIRDYRKSEQTYDKLEKQVVSVTGSVVEDSDDSAVFDEPSEEDTGQENEETLNENWWYEDVSIDFDLLQHQNSLITAWIRFDHQDQVPIDYPVVLPDNDQQYLYKDIYGKTSKAGTLFFEADYRTPLSGNCKKDIIYGHMMKNGSMFASLKKYLKDNSFYSNNPYFTVYQKGEAFRYRIFSVFITEAGSEVYEYGFKETDELYRKHIDYLTANSKVQTYAPDYDNNILTLSTCAKSNSNLRIVVTAEQIDRKTTG